MDFASFNFTYSVLSFLSIVLVLIYIKFFDKKQKYKLSTLIVPKKDFLQSYRVWFAVLFLIFFMLTSFRPRWGEEKQVASVPNTALSIVLDLSQSMLVEDIKPNRLVFAKMLIKKILDSLGTTNISLVAFSNKAITVSPPTTDYQLLKYYVDLLSPSMFSGGGTAINVGLREAVKGMKNFDRKAVLLISDGGDEYNPDTNLLKELDGVKVYSLLIGTKDGGPVPVLNNNGDIVSYKEYMGKTVIAKANDRYLKFLAKKTDGRFFRPSYLNLTEVFRELYSFRSKLTETYFVKKERYQYPLLLAILFFLGAFLL